MEEARVLLDAGQFSGAFYLAGYVVECALKACIAKQVRRFDFPDRATVIASYSHDLTNLVKVAGLERELHAETASDAIFARNWSLVERWSEQSRYEVQREADARALYSAIADSGHGVVRWLRRHW